MIALEEILPHLEGRTRAEAAERLNELGIRTPTGRAWTKGALEKFLFRHGVRSRVTIMPAKLTDAQIAWAERCIDEGMPATFIAEHLGRSPKKIAAKFHGRSGREDSVRAWKSVWADIRRHSALRELHDELRPKGASRR